eukprot:1156680-Pelagomonas_calceolata.AAC.1
MDPKEAGVKGHSCLTQRLPYLSPLNTWLMPVLHALLFGVAEKFVRTIIEGGKGYSDKVKLRVQRACVSLFIKVTKAMIWTPEAAQGKCEVMGAWREAGSQAQAKTHTLPPLCSHLRQHRQY